MAKAIKYTVLFLGHPAVLPRSKAIKVVSPLSGRALKQLHKQAEREGYQSVKVTEHAGEMDTVRWVRREYIWRAMVKGCVRIIKEAV